LIAERVEDLAEHDRRLRCPDLYRPVECAHCGHDRLHVHDRPERHPLGCPDLPPAIHVLVFRCPECRATWRILPRFLARHLWYAWQSVEATVKPSESSSSAHAGAPSEPSARRWCARLASAGRLLVTLLAIAGGALAELAARVGLGSTREAVLDAFVAAVAPPAGMRLSGFAALVHRLERGVRLM
jgi:predicted Zn-ribbon and HTH transcriptional regulator